MEVKCIEVGELGANAYILKSDKATVIIDPGDEYERLKTAAGDNVAAVLLTHAHFDHIGAALRFKQDGAKIYLHRDDVKLLEGNGNLAVFFGKHLDGFEPDVLVSDGDILTFGDITLKVLSTPGHTDGSVCYISDGMIFSGDTLFCMSVGRTDFPSGSAQKLHDSITGKLFALSGNYKVLSGHGGATTLDFERKNNPYV